MTTPQLIGVDVGGSKIASGIVTTDGRVLETHVRATPASDGPEAVLDAIAAAVGSLTPRGPVLGAGIGTGGVVDRRRGVVLSANDLLPGWAGTDLSTELGGRLRVPVAADNDVNAFALAEQYFGAGAHRSSVLYASVGTGIGGSLVLGGKLFRGAHCTAGELGHLAVPEAVGRRCNCGGQAHLEAVASGPAISDRFRELTGESQLTDLREVTARATAGEPAAVRAITEGAAALGRALGGLVNTIDVEHVVIGGGVTTIGDLYWQPLTEAFASELLPGPSAVTPSRATLGTAAAVVGAAALLLEDGYGSTGGTTTDRKDDLPR